MRKQPKECKSACRKTEHRRPAGSGPSQATELIAMTGDVELFHDRTRRAWASVNVSNHRENYLIRSGDFRSWLQMQYYRQHERAPSSQAMQDAVNTIESQARYGGPERDTYFRIAEYQGAMWIDIGDDDWQAVRIDCDGWAIIPNPPVLFRRSRTMQPLPLPKRGGSIDDLRPFLNVDDDGYTLIRSWLLGAMRPSGPYPVLVLHGEQGTAKSTTTRVLRELIDPALPPSRALSRKDQDLAIAADGAWLLAFDNVSQIRDWMSDALCQMATGSGFATRLLYTDRDESVFHACRPMMLNGIADIVTRSDLLDRSILVHLPTIEAGQRRTEREFWQHFSEVQPRILGCLYSAVSTAIREFPNTRLVNPPRMADFAVWVTAGEAMLNLRPGEFIRAYEQNRHDAHAIAIESCNCIGVLVRFIKDKKTWQGTATELLRAIHHYSILDVRDWAWPRNANALSGILLRHASNLKAYGVSVRRGNRRSLERPLYIEWVDPGSSSSPQIASAPLPGVVFSDDPDAYDDEMHTQSVGVSLCSEVS